MITVSCLWKRTSRDGNPYLSGTWGMANVMVFPVKNKKGENSPDYRLVIAEKQQRREDDEPGGGPTDFPYGAEADDEI